MELARLVENLSDPRSYPAPTTTVEVHQTHISVVFLTDAFAYKIKKPLALDFLDYSTLDWRRHWCDEEIRLNRRLAPRFYLGVVPIVEDHAGVRVEGRGPVVEWAVKMKRLPAAASLADVAERGQLTKDALVSVARRIVEFHRHTERSSSIARFGRFDIVTRNARENFEHSTSHVGTTVSKTVLDRVRTLTEEALAQHRGMIEYRADRGLPCEGHGDIRMDHVYLFPENYPPDDLAIVDCIEFNPRFRAADPIADMAFLVMDLIRHGHRELAKSFRDAYLAFAGDDQGARLVPFYVAYRAAVRAKVNGMKAGSPELSSDVRARARTDARAQWLLALASLEQPSRRPCLVLVGGLPGTGKSTLAQALASESGFVVIRSDEVRKDLAHEGGEPRSPAGEEFDSGIYTPEWTERTYRECLAQAERALFDGQRVIVDANFHNESHRRRFLDLASSMCVPAVLLLCQADPALVKIRLDQRRTEVSDADWAIYQKATGQWEPLGSQSQQCSHPIDTGRDDPQPLVKALEVLRKYDLWE